MELIEIERRLQHLLNQFGADLPPEQIEDMKELIQAGEPGVALENYCTQLFEYDVAVPSDIVNELEELGRAMGIHEKYWMRLRQ
ncbi:MafI family immunity protein [Sorangium sp. So ce1097]|uniref:MafI family immunity protein n=1 Tax=Sorangium sp. So ce1097 TaxID=3133330 RepID=UPI003F62B3DD